MSQRPMTVWPGSLVFRDGEFHCSSPNTARMAGARALYKSCYGEVFKKEIEDSKDKEVNCAICHEGTDKKNRTDYGKELAKELGEKNVRDREKIKAALEKIGPHPKHKKK
jgi:hypothetical protein